jgi:hypothetical protein
MVEGRSVFKTSSWPPAGGSYRLSGFLAPRRTTNPDSRQSAEINLSLKNFQRNKVQAPILLTTPIFIYFQYSTMSDDAASITTALEDISITTAPESSQLKEAQMKYGLTEQEVRTFTDIYGSLEAMCPKDGKETAEAENKAAMERAFPNGYAGFQVGVSDGGILVEDCDFPTCSQFQRKPEPGEEVTFAQLRDDLMIRVWGGDLASYQLYSFDFVNGERQYILTPDDVKIYTLPTVFDPAGGQVLSIEQSLEMANTSSYSHATRQDPNWETYIIHEGTTLRITQQNHPDRFLRIPTRIPNFGDATLVLQPA